MRVLVAALALAALAGCLNLPPRPTPTPSRESRTVVVSVFLSDDATEAQQEAIGSELRATPGVTTVTFVTREEAYKRFKKAFAKSPGPMASVRPGDLPESFQARMSDKDDADATATDMRRLAGVEEVTVYPLRTTASPTSS